jgi:hypothetical protein
MSDNFYKYSPNTNPINHKYPDYSFSQARLSGKSFMDTGVGPAAYDVMQAATGESYSMGKNPRFKADDKDCQGKMGGVGYNCYYTIGYLPGYMRGGDKPGDCNTVKGETSRCSES